MYINLLQICNYTAKLQKEREKRERERETCLIAKVELLKKIESNVFDIFLSVHVFFFFFFFFFCFLFYYYHLCNRSLLDTQQDLIFRLLIWATRPLVYSCT